MYKKTGAIVQARLGSERLPNKVLLELPPKSGVTVLERVIERLKRCKVVDEIIVTTPDRILADFAQRRGVKWSVYSGERNVLKEYYIAAQKFKIDIIVRITADCPCLDPAIVDEVVRQHLSSSSNADYTYSRNDVLGKFYGEGMDVEVFNFKAIEKVYGAKDLTALHREHVTSVFYDPPEGLIPFRIEQAEGLKLLNTKFSLDTQEDYDIISKLYVEFGPDFNLDDIRAYCEKEEI